MRSKLAIGVDIFSPYRSHLPGSLRDVLMRVVAVARQPVITLFVAGYCQVCSALEMLDQSYDPPVSSIRDGKFFDGSQVQSQTITFGHAGRLTRIETFLFGLGGSSSTIPLPLHYVLVPVTTAGVPDDSQPAVALGQFSLGFTHLSTNGQWISVDLRPFNIIVQKDQTLSWAWGGPARGVGGGGLWDGSSANGYARGQNFSKATGIGLPGQSGGWTIEPNSDRTFKAHLEPFIIPSFRHQPLSQTVTAGAPVTFTVAVDGQPTPTLQWLKDGINLPGTTGTTLVLNAAQLTDAGDYTVNALNAAGSVLSSIAKLAVTPAVAAAPVILRQPQSFRALTGGTATLSVLAGGTALSYQWQKDGSILAGATRDEFKVSGAQLSDAGNYKVTVTNSGGSVTSRAAMLSVIMVNSSVMRDLPTAYIQGTPLTVSLRVRPEKGVFSHAIEETRPVGWTVVNVTEGGRDVNGVIKWLKFDDIERVITYQVVAPANAQGPVTFTGLAAFDGLTVPIVGLNQSQPAAQGAGIQVRMEKGEVVVDFTGTALFQADDVTGPWTIVPGAQSPYRFRPQSKSLFFKSAP